MSDLVEKVQTAIARALHKDPEAYHGYFENAARAAIEAMREPTRKMIDAAWTSTTIHGEHPKGVLSHKTKTRTRWNAMIDAALTTDADQTPERPA